MRKLTFTQLRETGMPQDFVDLAIQTCKAYKVGRVSIAFQNTFHVWEDATFVSYMQLDKNNSYTKSARSGGEFGGFVQGDRLAENIAIPEQGYVLESRVFCGKWYVTIYHNNGQKQLS